MLAAALTTEDYYGSAGPDDDGDGEVGDDVGDEVGDGVGWEEEEEAEGDVDDGGDDGDDDVVADWAEFYSEQHKRFYYYSPSLGETSWNVPEGAWLCCVGMLVCWSF